MIATSSDVVQTALKAYSRDVNAIKEFDIGGFLVTLYRLVTDVSMIIKIKENFMMNEWDRIIESDNKSNKIFDYLVNPILSEGEVIGLILIIDVHTGKMFSEEQEHMAQIISQFLEKYLDLKSGLGATIRIAQTKTKRKGCFT